MRSLSQSEELDPVISLNLQIDIFVSKVCLATCCRKSFVVDCIVGEAPLQRAVNA